MRALTAEQRERFRAQLDGPECPREALYLLTWTFRLHGRSGVGMAGYAPLTEETLYRWSRRSGVADLTDDESEVVFMLDRVLCGFDTATYDPRDAFKDAKTISGRP